MIQLQINFEIFAHRSILDTKRQNFHVHKSLDNATVSQDKYVLFSHWQVHTMGHICCAFQPLKVNAAVNVLRGECVLSG
jgi:hypothetical protein